MLPHEARALRSEPLDLEALSSRRSHPGRRDRLRDLGVTGVELVRIRGPVGPPLGATSPGEVAASIPAPIVPPLRADRPSHRAGRG